MSDTKKTLQAILLADGARPRVVADCVQLVDDEVASKSGIGGLAVKGAYAVVKKIKPTIIKEAVDRLLDPFVEKLEPFFADFQQDGASGTFSSYLGGRKATVATALLGVTDARIEGSDHKAIRKAYQKLRPAGQKHVEAAVPGVGRVIDRHR